MKPVRNKFKLLTAAACILLAAATGFSDEERISAFPFCKDIILPAKPKDVSVFTIDADIYRATPRIPNGIRIVGPDGDFCPFILSEEMRFDQEWQDESVFPARITGFETLPDGSVRISASLNTGIPDSDDPRVVGLRILTKAKDFDKKVKIFDGSGKNLIAESAFLDYSSRVNLRNDAVRFPAPTREFSFVIVMDNYTEIRDSPLFHVVEGDTNIVEQDKFRESPKIDGISLQVVRKQKQMRPVTASSPVEILSQDKKGKTTVLTISNGFAPLNSITVECSDLFFSRPDRLYDKSGKLVASGTVRRLETGTFRTQISDRVINVPASSRSESWTLELDNDANAELKNIVLQASGPVYQIRFLSVKPAAATSSGYKVLYGGFDHSMPSSDFMDVLRSLEEPVPSDSTLSAQQDNPDFDKSGAVLSARDWGLLYKIMMGAAALAVFLILLFSVKKIDKVKE